MDIVITENQYKLLKEIRVVSGKLTINDIDEKFLEYITTKVGISKLLETTKKYLVNVLGIDIKKIRDEDINNYLNQFYDVLPKIFRNKDVISNLNYYLAKKYLNIKSTSNGLEYVIKNASHSDSYFFFDTELEELIGFFAVKPISEKYQYQFPRKTYQVALTMVSKEIKGYGYGKRIYLSMLDMMDCLVSDDTLFNESLNIWFNVLPKEVPVVGYLDFIGEYHRIRKNKSPNLKYIEVMFASNKPSFFKDKIK
jgi:hypothetical protein